MFKIKVFPLILTGQLSGELTVEPNPYEYWIRWAGVWGITYFFVLSGFLIGNIILNETEQLKEKKSGTVWQVLKVFYMRRALRIFPIYYILIIILLIIGFPNFIYDTYPWLFSYCSNIYIFLNGYNYPLSHFWSLSVEEHFIIIIPWIILFIPNRYIVHAIIFLGISGILCRTGLYLYKQEFYHIFTLSNFDSLAIGFLLAYIKIRNISIPYMKMVLVLSLILYVFLPLPSFMYFTGKTLLKVFIPSAAIFSMGLIFFASEARGITNFTKHLIENKIVLYLGKIGYGLYLYHTLIPYLRIYLLNFAGYSFTSMVFIYLIDTILLLIIASISFYLIENPVYSLKKHFQYEYMK